MLGDGAGRDVGDLGNLGAGADWWGIFVIL
jgi:hypothetical protein